VKNSLCTCRKTHYGMMKSPSTQTTTKLKRLDPTSSSGRMGKGENSPCWDWQSNTKTSSLLTSFSWFFSVRLGKSFKSTLKDWCTNFPKIWKPPQNTRCHIRMTWSKFHTEEPETLGAIVQNSVAMTTWPQGFSTPGLKHDTNTSVSVNSSQTSSCQHYITHAIKKASLNK
jgi:hypothetical protein